MNILRYVRGFYIMLMLPLYVYKVKIWHNPISVLRFSYIHVCWSILNDKTNTRVLSLLIIPVITQVHWLHAGNSFYNVLFFLSNRTNVYFNFVAQASRVLKLERYSLQYLLQHFCGITANKEYVVFTFWN